MYVDISRARFDPAKHYSAVLLQQGRVILDSDVAEQNAILHHYLRTAIADIVGPAATPSAAAGFTITAAGTDKQPDLGIGGGRMYVDGILVEAEETTYLTQPDGYVDPEADALPADGGYLVYLRVWERSVTALQDPDIREVALGIHGPDTTARAQVVWQVAAFPSEGAAAAARKNWLTWRDQLFQPAGTLQARAKQPEDADLDICSIAPTAEYRGRENQLYRVEILTSGVAAGAQPAPRPRRGAAAPAAPTARYVWSRDNGSNVYPIDILAGAQVTLASLGRDIPSGLNVGDSVEIVDDAAASRVADEVPTGLPRVLFTVAAIDALNCVATLDRDPAAEAGTTGTNPLLHPLLRRWDGTGELAERDWLDLEDGVQVRFPGTDDQQAGYRAGDYWLVPARTVLGDVIWPQDPAGPRAVAPHGVRYHYAPLAHIAANRTVTDLRETFDPMTA